MTVRSALRLWGWPGGATIALAAGFTGDLAAQTPPPPPPPPAETGWRITVAP